jgi:hypothetical protein
MNFSNLLQFEMELKNGNETKIDKAALGRN